MSGREDEEIAGEVGQPPESIYLISRHLHPLVRRAVEEAQRQKLVLARGDKREPTVVRTGTRDMLLGITGNAGRIAAEAIAKHGFLERHARRFYANMPDLDQLGQTHHDIEIKDGNLHIHLRKKQPSEIFIEKRHLPPQVKKALAKVKGDPERDIHFPLAVKVRGTTLGLLAPLKSEQAARQLVEAITHHGLIHEKHRDKYYLPHDLQGYSPIILSEKGLLLMLRRRK